MKVIASQLRKGNVVEVNDALYVILKAENFHPGKGTPVTQVDMRRIADGVKVSERWKTTDGVERAHVEEKSYQFLYEDDEGYHFLVCDEPGTNEEAGPTRVGVVAMPWFKAGVERAFRTYNSTLFHSIPGTTFSNILERGDYKSMARSSLTLSEAKQIFFTYVVDIYAQDFHKGLRDIPAQKWQAAIDKGFSPRVPTNPRELYVALGRVTERVLHHYGVKFLNLRYNLVGNDDLAHLRAQLDGKKVKVKYHPDDLSRIHIINPFNHQIIELPAIDPVGYTHNLSLWKHRVILKEAKKEGDVDVAALGRVRRRIRAMIDDSRDQKQLHARKKIARWDEPEKQPLQADPASSATQVEPSLETEDRREAYRKRMAELNKLVEDVSDEGWETGPSLSELNNRHP